MTCPSCGESNAATAKFCAECGTPLRASCPACGVLRVPGAKFCIDCGMPMDPLPDPTGSAEPSVYWQAMTWLESAEHHAAHGRDTLAEPLLAEARETFETVGARPALARVDQLARSLRAAASPTATAG